MCTTNHLGGHAHCIAGAPNGLHQYARLHDGRFPAHPDGYGAALMLMPEDTWWRPFTGPGTDPDALEIAKRTGITPAEGSFGRVYVQGLNLKSNPDIVILFDQRPTPGGDHNPLPYRMWRARGREVVTLLGAIRFIPETEWPAFARAQVELLVKEGFVREEAERLYGLATR